MEFYCSPFPNSTPLHRHIFSLHCGYIHVAAVFSWRFTVNINGHTSYHDGKFYETCSDCLLSEDTTLLPDGKSKGRYLFLFSKFLFPPSQIWEKKKKKKKTVPGRFNILTIYFHVLSSVPCLFSPHLTHLCHGCSFKARTGALDAAELQTFKKQAECLKFLPEYHFADTGHFSSLCLLAVVFLSQSIFFTNWRCLSPDVCPDDRQTASPAVEKTKSDQADAQPTAK